MAADTKIEWADHTFNPWRGCTKVSAACDHCYAERLVNGRLAGDFSQRVRAASSTWQEPRRWNRAAAREGKRARVFTASLADVFDNRVPGEWREDLWALIHDTPNLDWLLLTKRPQNIGRMLPGSFPVDGRDGHAAQVWGAGWPNVCLGTTVENQDVAASRIHHLGRVPARVRFLSCEPLLGDVRFTGIFGIPPWNRIIHWVIAGGESGPGARPMHPDWARSLRDQCAAAGVPFHFKQWGEWVPCVTDHVDGRLNCFPDGADCAAFEQEERRHPLISMDGQEFWRVGKKAAGRLLDGVQHDGVPDA